MTPLVYKHILLPLILKEGGGVVDGVKGGGGRKEQYFTLLHEFWWNPADSDWNVGIPWNSIRNPLEWLESTIPPDSKGIQVEFHSNRFQVHSTGFQGPFQPIPTHSNPFHGPFQHIPRAIPTHSSEFQVPSKCHVSRIPMDSTGIPLE